MKGTAIIDKEATARLLEPWLGSGLNIDELPVPRLVVVTIDENAPPDFETMRAELTRAIPAASFDDHRTWVDRLVSMANTTVLVGTAVLSLVIAATVLTVIFATRGAMSGNGHIIEVLHFIGAESKFVAREFEWHFFRTALKGALFGGGGDAGVPRLLLVGILSDSDAGRGSGRCHVRQFCHWKRRLSGGCGHHHSGQHSDHADKPADRHSPACDHGWSGSACRMSFFPHEPSKAANIR